MATTIKLKNSVTTTAAPSTLVQGETAVNITDKKVWVGDATSTPVQIIGAGAPVSGTTGTFTGNTTVAGTFSANGGATLGDASGDALTINSSAVSIPNGLNFDSNTFVIDATNNRVGVGTASPSHAFQVAGSNGIVANFSASVQAGIQIASGGAFNPYMNFFSSGTTQEAGIVAIAGSAALAFTTTSAGSERMRITSTGNVGIGTSSPNYLLSVQANSVQMGFSPQSGIGYLGNYSNAPIGFVVNNAEKMRLDTSGNLGLGVTPSAWVAPISSVLEMKNAFALYSHQSLTAGYLGLNTYYGSLGNTYKTTDYASQYYQYQGKHIWQTAPSGTAGNAITFTQAMTLDASGNLGIGTTSASSKVDATGTYRLQLRTDDAVPELRALTANGAAFKELGLNGLDIRFNTSNTERMRIDSSGKVLVNLTSTAAYLDGAISSVGVSTAPAICAKLGGSAVATQFVMSAWSPFTTSDNVFHIFGTESTFTQRGSISYNRAGGLTVYNTTSDYRAKTVKGSVENALSRVSLLKPCTGRMNGAEQDIDFFVAHELQEVVPSAVTGVKDELNEDGTPKYQMVDKSALIPLLTAAIQELKAEVDSLKAQLNK